jgi:hypothetical protein
MPVALVKCYLGCGNHCTQGNASFNMIDAAG